MPHPKVQAQGSAMVGRNQLGSRMGAQTHAIREGARGRQGDVEERWREVGKQRAVQVFIPGESGGWGDAGRLARRGRTKPDGAAPWLEAGKGHPFRRPLDYN